MRHKIGKDASVIVICEGIEAGKGLREILAADKTLPSYSTFMRWVNDDDEVRERYVRAREAQADAYADEIVNIADTEQDPNKARVRIDARKWVASKLKPKKYGDRLGVHGVDGEPGVTDAAFSRLAEALERGFAGGAGGAGGSGEVEGNGSS